MKKRNIVFIVTLLTVFICSIGFAEQQDEPKIEKGQLLQAPKIVRSSNILDRIKNAKSVTIFEEDFESGLGLWATSGSWGIGAPTSGPNSGHESTNCVATNLNGDYSNYADDWLISPSVSLGTATEIKLYFWEWFSIESGYDYGRVKISTDGGSNWTEVSNRCGSSNWRETMIDLTAYQNESIQLAFHFTSDYSVTYSGWYIDDICIELEEPEPLTATMISLNSQNFPFIYMNVAVDTFGVGFPDLEQSNFQVYENGTLQTDYFEVTPLASGGGSRLADIVFVLDVTGSMGDEIESVRNNMLSFVTALAESDINYRIGFVVFGDIIYVYNDGNMYQEQTDILSIINNIYLGEHGIGSGGDAPENQLKAMADAALMNYRPGAQKIQIMLTDATAHENDGVTIWTVESLISERLIPNWILVFPVFDVSSSNQQAQYIPIAEATNPEYCTYFHIYDNFNEIIDEIGVFVANTYLVRYRSSDPDCNGILRNVEVVVSYQGNQSTAEGSYMPCSAPQIERTQATLNLHTQPWSEGTEFTIEVEITDEIEPYTESATLYYKNTTESVYQSVSMYQTGKGEIWQGIIPGSDVETPGLDYYITATDGQSTSSDPSVDPMDNPYQFAILPNEAPVIMHNPVTTLTVNTPITISADITDNTNELAYAGLFYRKTGDLTYVEVEMSNTYGNTYEAEIPADYVTADGVDYYIKAEDNFGVGSYHGLPDAPHFIEPEYDLGFRPNPGGWQFSNSEPNMWPQTWWQQFDYSQYPYPAEWALLNSERFPDWPLFVDAFGEDQCYYNPPPETIIYKPSAVYRWWKLSNPTLEITPWPPHWVYWAGSCYGFAISSFLAFDDKQSFLDEFPNIGTFNNLYDLNINDETRKCINQLFIYQFGQDVLDNDALNKNTTPNETLYEIKQMFLSSSRDDKTLTLFNQNPGGGGHTIVPYKVEKDTDNPDLEYIYVYDNNRPDEDINENGVLDPGEDINYNGILDHNNDLKVTINTSTNTWDFVVGTTAHGTPQHWGGPTATKGLYLELPSSHYLTEPIMPKSLPPRDMWKTRGLDRTNFIEFYNTSQASITIEDQYGNSIGYADSLVFNNLTVGIPIIPKIGRLHPPIGYYIPADKYSIQMQEFSDSLAYFSVFTDTTVYSYSRSDANSIQTDYITYGNGVIISSQDEQDKKISFEAIAVNEDNEKVFGIENCSISQNDSLTFDIIERENFQIFNKSQRKTTKTYDLRVKLVSANVDTTFEHKGIEISANSSHQVTPNWDNLDNIPILIDEDMNGTFEDTIYVENQFSEGETPSTGGALNNNNIYIYPNPFNPDIEVGTIRYSLAKDGNVTIKIYDVAGNLVITLLENASQMAGEEQYIPWDGRNKNGKVVANGVYFYVIESSSGEKGVGKIAIVK
jgi:hypothetical protein